ncbi:hypothetical protein PI125_g18880 [Phytophthora idaei]|nr:hypothetical protein PI125_g18880 [Phytophthora idaei]
MQRHSELTERLAQTLSKTRNTVDVSDITQLFNSLPKVIIETNSSAGQVFNVDETGFYKAAKSKRVVAVLRSKNVWTTSPTTSFPITTIACGGASGFVVSPVFILPGKSVKLGILRGCQVPGATVTATPTGFVSVELFKSWLKFYF